jgi:glutamyl-Q tRNA(Asp) synthetase
VFRFAPSPNGYLHIGHAYSALVNQRLARQHGGRFLLRIEDIDTGRCRPEYEEAIFEDLAWLGVEWEKPVRRQSERFSAYSRALEQLREASLAYPCFCTRSDLARDVADRPDWPRDPDGVSLYTGACKHMTESERGRRLASGQSAALRLDMGEALGRLDGPVGWRESGEGEIARDISAEPSVWGDTIIGRRDVPASYHIAVVIDDADQGVTDVARGMDLFNATSLHRLLQVLLDLPAPNYRHHELLRDERGAKLSKSAHAKSIRALREEGVTAEEVRARLGFSREPGRVSV